MMSSFIDLKTSYRPKWQAPCRIHVVGQQFNISYPWNIIKYLSLFIDLFLYLHGWVLPWKLALVQGKPLLHSTPVGRNEMKLSFCSLFIKLICRHIRRRNYFSPRFKDYEEEAVSIYLSCHYFNQEPERKSGGEGTDIHRIEWWHHHHSVSAGAVQPITAVHCSRDMGTETKENKKVEFAVKTFLALCL